MPNLSKSTLSFTAVAELQVKITRLEEANKALVKDKEALLKINEALLKDKEDAALLTRTNALLTKTVAFVMLKRAREEDEA